MGDVVDYLTGDLPALLALLSGSDVRELEVRDGDLAVRLHRSPPPPGAPVSETGQETLEVVLPEVRMAQVLSPLVGTFYRAAQPGVAPLVSEDSDVGPDTVVGFVDVLGEPSEVEAGCTGTIRAALATDGQTVEYGQPLFEVELRD